MPVAINITIDVVQVAAGTGGVMLGQQQANVPGQGGSANSHSVGSSQTLRLPLDFVAVPGTEGSRTLANFNTAITTAVSDYAAASGTTLITSAMLDQINGWATGSP